MSETRLTKKVPEQLKERAQYFLAFGVIATMLFVAGFPLYIITFFGVFAYLLWKTFAQPSSYSVREVFEFYLSANEKLADSGRRWFGFELQQEIAQGEKILHRMQSAPPLVYFALGALYHKTGDHKSAVNHLSYVLENEFSGEEHYAFATPELKNYVKVLRRIEREPAQAPLTSAAIKALEAARRNRGPVMLAESRAALEAEQRKQIETSPAAHEARNPAATAASNGSDFSSVAPTVLDLSAIDESPETEPANPRREGNRPLRNGKASDSEKTEDILAHHKPITEVLHEIYDKR